MAPTPIMHAMPESTLIRAQRLSRRYGDHCAVRDLSLELHRGEVLGFLGLNGAGKSTTLKLLSGNLRPDSGQVWIAGHALDRDTTAAQARLGYLPEHPPVYGDLSVDEYLRYAARLHRVDRARLSTAVDEAKARCGLTQVGRQLIGTLSKGYQQRVGIAQAIVHQPDVVLLDEPTVGLDPAQIRDIRNLIRELGHDHAVMLSSHILPEVEALCSRVLILHRGQVVFSEAMDQLTRGHDNDTVQVAFDNPPGVEQLAAVPGIETVEDLGGGHFLLRRGHATTDALTRAALDNDWGLSELIPRRRGLEQVFVELTCADDAPREKAG